MTLFYLAISAIVLAGYVTSYMLGYTHGYKAFKNGDLR